jgi:hypothetical protein
MDNILTNKVIIDKGFHSIIDIKLNENSLYSIDYIQVNFHKDCAPEFRYSTLLNVDLKSELRDTKIESLLKAEPIEDKLDFDVESIIYTPTQLERIKKLRNTVATRSCGWTAVRKVKLEYSENFCIGQKVFYNGQKKGETVIKWI